MKGIFASLAAALLIIAILFYSLFSTASPSQAETKNPPKYHVQVITQNTNEHFWSMFKQGASKAGFEMNVYVEFVDIAQKNTDSSVQALEKAIFSKVDGVALQAQDITKTSAMLKKAKDNHIAAVTFENELGYIQNITSVGSNSYEIGLMAGKMGADACKGNANAAVIVNGANEKNSQKNLKVQGINSALSKYFAKSDQHVYTLNSGMFETEKLMSRILSENPNINLIICTDERSTPGIAQYIVDENRVGEISIIGYGAMPQTLNYIERGVIYGSVCPDAYQIGYKTIEQLCAALDKKTAAENINNINTELFSISKKNVSGFMVKSDEK